MNESAQSVAGLPWAPTWPTIIEALERGEAVGIGTLTWAIRTEEQRSGSERIGKGRFWRSTSEKYAPYLADREDFAVFLRTRDLFYGSKYERLRVADAIEFYRGLAACATRDPLVVSGISASFIFALGKSKRLFRDDALFAAQIATIAQRFLDWNEHEPSLPPEQHVAARVQRCLLRLGVSQLQKYARVQRTFGSVEYSDELMADMVVIDPTWVPGRIPNLAGWNAGRRALSNISEGPIVDTLSSLAGAFRESPRIARDERIAKVRGETTSRSGLIALLAQTAYLTARKTRDMDDQAGGNRKSMFFELDALTDFADAALADGQFLLSNRLTSWLVRVAAAAGLRQRIRLDDPHGVRQRLEEAGYDVRNETLFSSAHTRSGDDGGEVKDGPIKIPRPMVGRTKDRSWPMIEAAFQISAATPWAAAVRTVSEVSRSDVRPDDEVIEAAARIAMNEGAVRSAVALVGQTVPTKANVRRFAEDLHRILRRGSLGLDVELCQMWQNQLRDRWSSVVENGSPGESKGIQQWTADERFIVHETLMDRLTTNVLSSPFRSSMLKKAVENDERDAVLAAYDHENAVFFDGAWETRLGDVLNALEHRQRAGLAPTVCISIVRVSSRLLSVLALGGQATAVAHYRFQGEDDIDEKCHAIEDQYPSWSKGVTWGEFAKLADVILELANKVASGSRCLLLAVDPSLARLPWQNLFYCYARRTLPIVSLVPSMSWISVSGELVDVYADGLGEFTETLDQAKVANEPQLRAKPLFLASRVEELRQLAGDVIREVNCLIDVHPASSVGVLVGHGKCAADGGLTWSQIEDRNGKRVITAAEWISFLQHRVCVVHSCHGGRLDSEWLGDLGGLPAIALSLGCRLFLAPVAEPTVETALTLNNYLFRSHDGTLGISYKQAMRSDSRVSFYQLFGCPDETLRGT